MWVPPPVVKKKPACCRPPRPWIPAGSPGWPRTSSTGSRPQLIIRASLDAMAGTLGAPAGEMEGGGTVPAETVQRYACDSAISRVTGRGELDHELSHAARTIPAPTRRALESRDRHCV